MWEQPCEGHCMYQVFVKLKRLQVELKKLNKEFYSNIYLKVKSATEDLVGHQTAMQKLCCQ